MEGRKKEKKEKNAPIPIPITNRAAKRPCQDLAKPDPIGVAVRQAAVTKISPLLPKYLFRGSTMKAPLYKCQPLQAYEQEDTDMRPAVKKMMALMMPTIHSSLPSPSIPNSFGKDKFAPFEPV